MDRKEADPMRFKRLLIALLLLVNSQWSIGYAEHVFEVGVHGGIADWTSRPVYVNKQMGFHGGGQIYYDYLSPYVVGFRTGLTLDCHNAGFGRKDYEDNYSTIDVEHDRMEINYSLRELSERYTTWSVGIPLQLALSQKNVLLLLGAKAAFPLTTTWEQTVKNVSLYVYYPTYDNRVDYPYNDVVLTQKDKVQLPKIQWWLSAELSYMIPLNKWAHTNRSYIIVGAYFDYCLSNCKPVQDEAQSVFMLTDTRDGFPLEQVQTPLIESYHQGRPIMTQCALFDIGIKISFALASRESSRRPSYPCHCLGVW